MIDEDTAAIIEKLEGHKEASRRVFAESRTKISDATYRYFHSLYCDLDEAIGALSEKDKP